MHVTAKFRHPTFNRLEVIVLRNKQTPPKTSISLRYATPAWVNICNLQVGNWFVHSRTSWQHAQSRYDHILGTTTVLDES